MPQRSWLAKAKSIHDLGNHFYVPDASKPWDDKRDAEAEARWLERLRQPLPSAVETPDFYGSRMHDAGVMSVERTSEVFRLTVDDVETQLFSSALADLLEVPRRNGPWPIELRLYDPQYVRAARFDRRGGLRFESWERLTESRGERQIEFLYDWFHMDAGRLQWIADLYFFIGRGAALSPNIYLMIDCARAGGIDRRREALVAAFGEPAGSLWDDLRGHVDVEPGGPRSWSGTSTRRYLLRRMHARGLTRSDFLV